MNLYDFTALFDPDANVIDHNFDDDGLSDGLEMGVMTTVAGIGGAADGTNASTTFTWTVNGLNVTVHNYTADADPTTVTDPKSADTDSDGVPNGVDD